MSIKDQIKAAENQENKKNIFEKALKTATFASNKTVRKWQRAVSGQDLKNSNKNLEMVKKKIKNRK